MYDDDEDDDEDLAADLSNEPTYTDPIVNLKEAFTLGQAALKLFFFEDNQDDKFEVIQISISTFRANSYHSSSNNHAGYLQCTPSAVHYRHQKLH